MAYDPKKPVLPDDPNQWLTHILKHSKEVPGHLMFYSNNRELHIYPMDGYTVSDEPTGPPTRTHEEEIKVALVNPHWVETGSGWRKIC